ncbi:hypothetical protein PAXINDRAFT_99057 [Paxillus involutus ATCC 200175]|nr:hypothetical protein PAXINDRAFT_99057 [Paxillus involutus ATCC 200175]
MYCQVLAKSGLHATSLHIGQIAGGPNGSWATTDWFPIVVKSSVALGVLPEAYGFVSWMREECVAGAILDVAFAKEAPPPALNLVNPRSAPWVDVIRSIRDCVIKEKGLTSDALPVVPFADWFALLEKNAGGASKDDLVNIPGLKLLEFFRAMALGDQVTRQTRPGITEPIGEAEAESWVQYWISKGSF